MEKLSFHFVIGDIHGCKKELLALEAKLAKIAGKKNRTPQVVSVGDLVDRGPNSAGVVEHFCSRPETHLALIGNHELLMLEILLEYAPQLFVALRRPRWLVSMKDQYRWRKGLSKNLSFEDFRVWRKCLWLGNGGHETLSSYGAESTDPSSWRVPLKHLQFLLNCELVWENKDVLVTHALAQEEDLKIYAGKRGRTTVKSKKKMNQAIQSLIWNRDEAAVKRYGKLHLSGHTPLRSPKRLKKQNALQIDTGCVYGQKLTAYCVETKDFVSVPSGFSWS